MATKSRLGRGLGGLIAGGVKPPPPPAAGSGDGEAGPQPDPGDPAGRPARPAATAADRAAAPAATPAAAAFLEIPIGQIETNPYQPRREIDPDQLRELAESISAEGLLQPLVVRRAPAGDGGDGGGAERYQLIAGERRWRACQLLRLKSVPARVIEAGDASSAAMSLIENLQREDLNPIEEAGGYASLIRDFDLTQEAVAERVGKGRATVANALRLLQLDGEIQGFIAKNLLSAGHAKVLLGVDDGAQRSILARRTIEEGLSVRGLEQVVKRLKAPAPSAKPAPRSLPETEAVVLRDLESRIATTLSTTVQLKHSPKKGRIVIDYHGNDDLQRILEKMGIL